MTIFVTVSKVNCQRSKLTTDGQYCPNPHFFPKKKQEEKAEQNNKIKKSPMASSSKCPLHFKRSSITFNDIHKMTSLPWTSFYTQSSKEELTPTIMSTYAMALTILFTVFVFTLEHMLDHRQERAYKSTEFPTMLEETVSKIDNEKAMKKKDNDSGGEEKKEKKDGKELDTDKPLLPQLKDKFTKAQSYGLDKIRFGMFSSVYNLVETLVFLLAGFLPYTWDLSVRLGEKHFGYNETDNEIKITLIFMLITTIFSTFTSLPFELVRFFGIF